MDQFSDMDSSKIDIAKKRRKPCHEVLFCQIQKIAIANH